jgi:hypothetical protein
MEIFKINTLFFFTLSIILTLQQHFKNHFEDVYIYTYIVSTPLDGYVI